MKNIKNILLVVDSSKNDVAAIESGLKLARLNHASIKIVKVVDNLSRFIKSTRPILDNIIDIRKLILDDLEKNIKKKVKTKKELEKITYKILEGSDFIEIIREVIRHHHDLLIVSAYEEKKIDVGFFSGTNFHLLRKCPCPVWVVKSSQNSNIRYKNLLVAVDLEDEDEDEVKANLNIKLMNHAILLAEEYHAKLHVFYAWQLFGEDTLRNSPFIKIKKNELAKKLKAEKQKNLLKLNAFVEKFRSDKITIHQDLYKGPAARLIPGFIRKNRIDLLVIGTVCRVGIPGFIIGNAAEEILREIRCSVLTIKPDGFVSPVE